MISGGFRTYGKVAGILMLDSRIPRIPGDPGHAQTFPFPVSYAVVKDLPFKDLVEARADNVGHAIDAALDLQSDGVSFVAADCGLFSIFQQQIASALSIPFIGSSLSLIPHLCSFFGPALDVGVITGHAGMLSERHLRAAGADPARVVAFGMECSREFTRVVIERGETLDGESLAHDVESAARSLAERARASGRTLGAVVIECTNLVAYREQVQRGAGAPVYDLVSLIDFFAEGFAARRFPESHQSFRSGRGWPVTAVPGGKE